jgi:Fe-S cluster assembly protein SufD
VYYPRTLILAGKNSKLAVLESYVGLSDNNYFTNAVTEIVAGEGSEIEHYRYLMESPHAFHIGTSRVFMHKDSHISSTSLSRGSQLARNDLGIELNGTASSCSVNGLYFTSDSQHVDNHIDIDHASTHTSSNQDFKGILSDSSRAVFSGRVLVRKGAQKSYARQSDKNLLLSVGARINTKPSLEIFADDVECYHGATAGALAEEAIFYMCSRGLDKKTARQLLVSGFANEIIEKIGLRSLRNHMNQIIANSVGFNEPNKKPKGKSLR